MTRQLSVRHPVLAYDPSEQNLACLARTTPAPTAAHRGGLLMPETELTAAELWRGTGPEIECTCWVTLDDSTPVNPKWTAWLDDDGWHEVFTDDSA